MKTLSLVALTLTTFTTQPAFARIGGSSTVGPGNPAAFYCEENGGQLESVRTQRGDDALCRFDRGAVGQWSLFRAKGRGGEKAVDIFFAPKKVKVGVNGNPASLFCVAQGGKSEIGTLRNGDQIGVCKFDDNSSIEEWTLFRGATDASNAALVNALRN